MAVPRRLVLVIAVALAAGGCLTTHDVLAGPAWSLVEVHGAPPVAEGGIQFGTDGTFGVRTGCTTVGGSYHLDGNRILVDSGPRSAMPCEGELATQEAAMLAVIENRPSYAFDTGSGRLRLTSDAGQVLVFEAP